jgi:hypothetical protein
MRQSLPVIRIARVGKTTPAPRPARRLRPGRSIMSHPAAWPVKQLLAECDVERTRRSGPGGQHRNKVETAVVITHRPTGVRAEASERRSQAENLAQATRRLRVRLALEVRTSRGARSPLWISRTSGGKILINPQHDDFPAILAEALDHLAAAEWLPAAAGEQLGTSASQLVKLLKLESEGLALVNRQRQVAGLSALR